MTNRFASLILTRPEAASHQFLKEYNLQIPGLDVIVSPILEIVSIGAEPDLEGVKGAILTSPNGVLHGGAGHPIPTYCVGQATARAAKERGWDVKVTKESSTSLLSKLLDMRVGGPLLHIGGVHRRGSVAEKLRQAGIEAHEIDVYDQKLLPLSQPAIAALEREEPTIVPLFSPRTARHFAKQIGTARKTFTLAISEAVKVELHGSMLTDCAVADTPDGPGMARALENLLRRVEAEHAPK